MNRTTKKKCHTKLYSITISPPASIIDPLILYDNHIKIIRRWLNSFSEYYEIVPEFDDNIRLHYHGVVNIKDEVKFYKTKYRIQRQIGFIKIKRLVLFIDHLRWSIYIHKNYYKIVNDFSRIIYKKKKRINYKKLKLLKKLKEEKQNNIINYIEYLYIKERAAMLKK